MIQLDPERLLAAAVGFGRELRAAGVAVAMPQTLDFVRALGVMDLGERADVRSASRSIHVRRREDVEVHDALFDSFWSARRELIVSKPSSEAPHRGASGQGPDGSVTPPRRAHPGTARDSTSAAPAFVVSRRSYSREELLRQRDFDRMTPDELREAERLFDRLATSLATRPARRYEIHAHGTRLAPRPMLRRSVATGGELVDWLWRRPRVVPRPVTLLIDVSGSMESHARMMLRFAHSLRRVNRRAEVFVFGTRLTRVTRALAARNADEALARVSTEVADWSGGTRIGDCLREYNNRWARRVGSSDGIVVVMSDGWDRGDPDLVGTEAMRLRRNCRRLLWLNPLAAAAGFEPLAAGMAAAARHVDRLLPAGSLDDLEDLAGLLTATRWGGRPSPQRQTSPESTPAIKARTVDRVAADRRPDATSPL
ncbi:MAG: VWA domain-containing protein [Chloroflexota bacterium]